MSRRSWGIAAFADGGVVSSTRNKKQNRMSLGFLLFFFGGPLRSVWGLCTLTKVLFVHGHLHEAQARAFFSASVAAAMHSFLHTHSIDMSQLLTNKLLTIHPHIDANPKRRSRRRLQLVEEAERPLVGTERGCAGGERAHERGGQPAVEGRHAAAPVGGFDIGKGEGSGG